MAQNLRNRLQRIQRGTSALSDLGGGSRNTGSASARAAGRKPTDLQSALFQHTASWPGWSAAGFNTLKRELSLELPFSLPPAFPKTLAILIPDLARLGRLPGPEELIFFDLETTGLSGGAGTLAFLAAFGRFASPSRLEITQYLLLDYPGEEDFIEQAAKEFTAATAPLVVSFNGKSFDSQILRNRCLMNGMPVPEYFQVDLLHPARRLWKRLLPDCCQATIEVSVLGLDRTGDVSGALAPDIWFSFLRNGENNGNDSLHELLSVCDHNARDITGLASLFLALGEIAAEGLASLKRFRFDEEALALIWNETLKKRRDFFDDDESYQKYTKTGEFLLQNAADAGFPRAAFVLALDFLKKGRFEKGRTLLRKAADGASGSLRAAVLKALAIDAEWRLGDINLASEFTAAALNVPEISDGLRKELEKRCSRLEEKRG